VAEGGEIGQVCQEDSQLDDLVHGRGRGGQRSAQVREDLAQLSGRVAGPGQLAIAVERELPGDDHQAADRGDRVAVAVAGRRSGRPDEVLWRRGGWHRYWL
jgi:hypothetical protein